MTSRPSEVRRLRSMWLWSTRCGASGAAGLALTSGPASPRGRRPSVSAGLLSRRSGSVRCEPLQLPQLAMCTAARRLRATCCPTHVGCREGRRQAHVSPGLTAARRKTVRNKNSRRASWAYARMYPSRRRRCVTACAHTTPFFACSGRRDRIKQPLAVLVAVEVAVATAVAVVVEVKQE